MLFSILIPVRDDPANLARCVRSLAAQDLRDCEVLIADDGSRPPVDETPLRRIVPVLRVLRLEGEGPAAARNALAEEATGEYLFFVDADTEASPTLLRCARRVIQQRPGIRSFFGSYDDEPAWPSLVSTYRNLLHHHVHHESGNREVSSFWCGCGVVQRQLYLECGGLSELFRTPSIEDVAFGMRLADSGVGTWLVPELQVKHLKRWTFANWLRTDLVRRGIPWIRLMRARGEWTGQLNFSPAQRLAAVAAVAMALAVLFVPWNPGALIAALPPLALFVYLNRRFFRLVAAKRGLPTALLAVPLHLLYALVCAAAFVIGLCCPPLKLEHRTSSGWSVSRAGSLLP